MYVMPYDMFTEKKNIVIYKKNFRITDYDTQAVICCLLIKLYRMISIWIDDRCLQSDVLKQTDV